MKKINIQILVNEEEFSILQKEADKYGLTVPLYVKSEILKKDDFGTAYRQLIEKVDNLQSGTKFNIRALFGVDWTMSKGVKLNLGKTYYNQVKKGVIKNATALYKDSSNVQWYEKKEVKTMTKEQELMNFLHEKVFNPILSSPTASHAVKSGVNLTIARMNKLSADKMIQYYWSALSTTNAIDFSKNLKKEKLPRFEDVREEFEARFNEDWLGR